MRYTLLKTLHRHHVYTHYSLPILYTKYNIRYSMSCLHMSLIGDKGEDGGCGVACTICRHHHIGVDG